jgi:hypothetical protein
MPVLTDIFPAHQIAFREFDADKWQDFSKKYVSYYHVTLAENSDYPTKEISPMKVEYNDQQVNFFLSFVDEDLGLNQLKVLLAEDGKTYSDQYLKMHSSRIQKELLRNVVNGREIGNLEFQTSDGKLIEPPKFLKILDLIKGQPGQVAVYSSYFTNGIKKFAAFLDRHGMKNDYLILDPNLPVSEQMAIVDQYNQAKKRILLIHPDITEGISLNGTEQFHILEPLPSSTLQEQIIGRAIRYRSHLHLPEDRRVVHVYLWKSDINYSPVGPFSDADTVRRAHWQEKYSEVNPSSWSKGINALDVNYFLKDGTPDNRTLKNSVEVDKDVESFRRLLDKYSIERSGGG